MSILTSSISNIKDLNKNKIDEIITQAEKDLSKENITDQEKFLFDQKIDALKLIN